MIFKVYYQEKKDTTPRRENTRTLYLDLKVKDVKAGIIKVREQIAKKTNYRIEFIDALSTEAEAYEKKTKAFEITKL